jgi:hypothetical protein
MDFTKYNQVPIEPATAAQIGLAAATLSAMARRGLVEVIPGKPNKYRRIDNPAIRIHQLLEENKNDFDEFFTLRKKDAALGMLCWLKGGEVVDCWGNKYDLSDVITLELRTKKFDI